MRIKFVFSICTELAALSFISGRALGDEKRNIFKAQPVTSHTERNNSPPKEEKKTFPDERWNHRLGFTAELETHSFYRENSSIFDQRKAELD